MRAITRKVYNVGRFGGRWMKYGLMRRLNRPAEDAARSEGSTGDPGEPIERGSLVFDLQLENSRYLYNLYNHLKPLGSPTYLRLSPARVARMGRDEGFFILDEPNVVLTARMPSANTASVLVTDRPVALREAGNWKHIIQLSYDYYQALERGRPDKDGLTLPFGIHPRQLRSLAPGRLDALRSNSRSISVLFCGAVGDGYRDAEVENLFHKSGRNAIFNQLLRSLDSPKVFIVHDVESALKALDDQTFSRKLVVFASTAEHQARIPSERWLEVLSKAQALVCPPGVFMPHCHNLIEAMSVGTVPITQYGDLFDPVLRDGENAIGFRDLDDLGQKVSQVLDQREGFFQRFRKNVIEYYEKNLAPGSLLSRIRSLDPGVTRMVINAGGISAESYRQYHEEDQPLEEGLL